MNKKKISPHYYKLSSKFKNASAFLLRDARHALAWQISNAHLCNPPKAFIEVGDWKLPLLDEMNPLLPFVEVGVFSDEIKLHVCLNYIASIIKQF